MQTLFGFDLSTAQKVIVASVVILVLLILLGLFVRQIQGGRLRLKGQGGGRARQPRLGVVDTHDLDRQRQLVLIRRDNVEHLIMIGGASDVVVETNILRSGARAAAPPPMDFAVTERPPAFETLPPPEPARPESMRQDTMRQDTIRQEPIRQEPIRQDPLRQELPPAAAQAAPEPLPPLPLRPLHDPAASRPAPSQVPFDAAATAAVAVPAAIVAASFQQAVAAPTPAPVAAAAQAMPAPAAAALAAPNFSRDNAPSPTASAVELDSMARQLEEALKRPFSAVRPANSQDEPVRAPDLPKQAQIMTPVPQPEAVASPPPPQEPVMMEPVMVEPLTVEPEPVLPTPTPPAPPVTVGRPVRLPADVEAELEIALGLKPERTSPVRADAPVPMLRAVEPPAAPEPEPEPEFEPEPAPEPQVATMIGVDELRDGEPLAETPKPAPEPEQSERELEPEPELEPVVEPAPPHEPEFMQAAAHEPEPAHMPEPEPRREPELVGSVQADAASHAASHAATGAAPVAAAEPEPRPAPAPAPDKRPAAIDPFSVDAIEAEFARLLGRDPRARS